MAYQAEGALPWLIMPRYRQADEERRTLIQAALPGAADLKFTKREPRVTLAPQSPRYRTRAITVLCKELTRSKTLFPDSRLRLG